MDMPSNEKTILLTNVIMYTLPHTIENTHGKKLIFLRLVQDPNREILETEGWAQPGAGPVMHVHWKQDKSLTVVSGKMATQVPGEVIKYYEAKQLPFCEAHDIGFGILATKCFKSKAGLALRITSSFSFQNCTKHWTMAKMAAPK